MDDNCDHKPRIIVVDDDAGVRETVAEYLGLHGFAVRAVSGGAALDRALAAEPAELLLLDVNMPAEDGFSVARRVRAISGIPIIMLTGAGDIVDRIVGLELGADDYITKPFDLREIKARIRAVLRRKEAPPTAAPLNSITPAGDHPATALPLPVPSESLIRFGIAFLDLDAHSLVRGDGVRETLTAMEFDLLRVFAVNPNRVLSRDRLLDLAHRRDNEPYDRSIDVRVTRLRKKVEADPSAPRTIRTIRGVGYMFSPSRRD